MFVVTENLIFGTVIDTRKGIDVCEDFVKLLALGWDAPATGKALETLFSSGTTMSDCGPSAALKVHRNVCDWTPRCWQEFFSSAGSSMSGLPWS